MNPAIRITTAGALSALLLCSGALAQPAPAPGPPLAPATPAQPAKPKLSPATEAAVNQRIATLKARLAITPAQEPAWNAFAETMRDNAADTDALFAQRAAGAATMTAEQNMHSYAAIANAYAQHMQRLSDAFDTLYAGLSDAQKHAADVLFQQQAAAAEKPASR